MNDMVKDFRMSKNTQLMFQDILDVLPVTYRETLIDAMASYSSELQLHVTGCLLKEFREELSKSLKAMISVMPKSGGNGSW